MKIVVCDAGPIIHLYEAGILLLLKHVGKVYLPHSVFLEVISIIKLFGNCLVAYPKTVAKILQHKLTNIENQYFVQ